MYMLLPFWDLRPGIPLRPRAWTHSVGRFRQRTDLEDKLEVSKGRGCCGSLGVADIQKRRSKTHEVEGWTALMSRVVRLESKEQRYLIASVLLQVAAFGIVWLSCKVGFAEAVELHHISGLSCRKRSFAAVSDLVYS